MSKEKKSKQEKDYKVHKKDKKSKKKKSKSKKDKKEHKKVRDNDFKETKGSDRLHSSANSKSHLEHNEPVQIKHTGSIQFDPIRHWCPILDSFYDPVMAGNADGSVSAGPHDRAIRRAVLAQSSYRLEPSQLHLLGVHLAVDSADDDGQLTEAATEFADSVIFVGRLDPAAEESDLRRLFESCGLQVSACRLVRDWATGHSRRYGFVRFDSADAAGRALHCCDGASILGRPVLLDRERSLSQPGWVPRRLGGGLGGRKESGQLRFGCRARPFRRPTRRE